jgi:hypothetical protein
MGHELGIVYRCITTPPIKKAGLSRQTAQTGGPISDAKLGQVSVQINRCGFDRKGNDYLPHLFGRSGYVVIRRPTDLPKRSPLQYAQLTGSA